MDYFSQFYYILYFYASAFFIYSGFNILRLDQEKIFNRLFFITCISLGFWAFSDGFALLAPDAQTSFLWQRKAFFISCIIYSMLFHLFLLITEKKELLKKRWIYTLIYLPSFILIYLFLLENILWILAFNMYFTAVLLSGLILIREWGKNAEVKQKKKSAELILITLSAPLLAGIIFDIFLPALGMNNHPPFTVLLYLFPIWAISYTFSELTTCKHTKKALKKAHNEMEKKIIERTEELTKTNRALSEDMKEHKKIQSKIRYLAYHDAMTELPNRHLFMERLNEAIHQAERTENLIAVVFLDLDNFKRVNDTLGHTQGDKLLKKVADRLTNTLRKSDTVARLAGDEFIIMLQNISNSDSVVKVVEKISAAFNKPFKLKPGREFQITTSIGVAIYPTDGKDVETLIKNADIAMYKAKDRGKNQYMFCSAPIKSKARETVKLTNDLYNALDRGEMKLYYQPQVNQNMNQIVGMEALLRWKHPEYGFVPPDKIIPIAEQTGLIHPVGKWVLKTACEQNKAWQNKDLAYIRISVNISALQLQNQGFVEQVKKTLKQTGMENKYLELEITESILINKAEHIIEILSELKDLGIKIMIDDFGTKYSSLLYLKELPINRIKIAMPFIHGISVSKKDEAITRAIIILADNLGLSLIAEGVESENQLQFLNNLTCNEIQGFYYYEPMSAQDAEELFENTNNGNLTQVIKK